MLNRLRGLIQRGAYPHFISERFFFSVGEINILFTLADIDRFLHDGAGHNVCWGGKGIGHWNPKFDLPSELNVIGNDEQGRLLIKCSSTKCYYTNFAKCVPVAGRGRPNQNFNSLTESEKEAIARLKSMNIDVELIQDITGCDINAIISFWISGVYRQKKCPCGEIWFWVEQDGYLLNDTSPAQCPKCRRKAQKAALGLPRQYEEACA